MYVEMCIYVFMLTFGGRRCIHCENLYIFIYIVYMLIYLFTWCICLYTFTCTSICLHIHICMYVCMIITHVLFHVTHAFIDICVTYRCIHICTQSIKKFKKARVIVRRCAVHWCLKILIFKNSYICCPGCMHSMCVYIYVCVCICVYIYIHVFMHLYHEYMCVL